jgi:hypothetical protein
MRVAFTFLLAFSSILLYAQQDCNYQGVLNKYNEVLPEEKVYVQTDRSFYEPGDQIWFKAYLVDPSLKKQAVSNQLRAELIDPIGNPVGSKLRLDARDGSVAGDFLLTADASGGIYKLRVYSLWQENFGEALIFEKELTVQANIFPNLLMTLDFLRESYAAGGEVSAKFEVRSKDNKALANKKGEFEVSLAGKSYKKGSFETNLDGQTLIQFELPKDLKTADGLLNLTLEHDGRTESIARSVPIITQNISLNLMPEGGDLIAGIKNNIAFKAVDEFGKPVDFEGRIINQEGEEIKTIESFHQGMGAFNLEVKAGEKYQLEITQPQIDQKFELPKALDKAIGLQLKAQNKTKNSFSIYSPEDQPLCIIAQMQGKVVYEVGMEAKAGMNTIDIPNQNLPMGIAQITVFDANEIPHAERLVFLNKDRQLDIQIKTNQDQYQIRDSVWVDLWVKDETGKGVVGDFSMAVVDDKVFTFADDKQDNILSYLLMSSDLKGEVYEPNFYFDPKEEKAEKALDLVMMTHGWRRYEWRSLLAKNAEKEWQKQRQIEPEPATALAGQVMLNGQPYANAKIQLKAHGDDSCYTGPKTLRADKEGKFYFPNYASGCPISLEANHRGIKGQRNVAYNPPREKVRSKTNVLFQRKRFTPSRRPAPANNVTSNDYAASNSGKASIRGVVLEAETAESIAFATVVLEQNGVILAGTTTDIDGNYVINNIEPGAYNLVVKYIGYDEVRLQVQMQRDRILRQNIEMGSSAELLETVVTIEEVRRPRIEVDQLQIERLAVRDISTIAVTTAGVNAEDKGTMIERSGGRDLAAELPVQPADQGDVVRPAIRADRARKRMAAPIFRDELRARPASEQAQLQKVKAVPVQTLTETSNLKSMARLKGEAANLRQKDKIIVADNKNVSGPNINLSFNLDQSGAPAFYTSRAFYAPDYTEYLAARKQGRAGTINRSDFRNTIYWEPYISTDENGHARRYFFNSDASSTFRIIVEGLGDEGQVGRQETTYSVQMPFEIDVKMPKTLTFGDEVLLPVVLKNNSEQAIEGELSLVLPVGLQLKEKIATKHWIEGKDVKKIFIPIKVIGKKAYRNLLVNFTASGMSDQVELACKVVDKGFPMLISVSGKEQKRLGRFNIEDLVEGSLNAKLNVYANVLEDLKSAMEGLLREPSGCFEQVSSSNYPNLLALQVMKATNDLDPKVYDRAMGYLNNGYKKLAGYESAGGGFEWFGASPAHPGLTAYGLMEFKDMEEVYPFVDQAMVDRAKKWLLSRKDGKGGFLAKNGYNHGWGKSEAVSNAYITYALAYTGERNISQEVQAMTNEALNSKDLYRLALASLTHFEMGNQGKGEELLNLLQDLIQQQGINNLKADHSITYSSGVSLKAEILGLSILATLEAKTVNEGRLREYLQALMQIRTGGRFGSTQSTIWALKAITAYALFSNKKKAESGQLIVKINQKEISRQEIKADQMANIYLSDLAQYLKEGENSFEIEFEGMKAGLPYSLDVEWVTLTPPAAQDAMLKVETKLAANTVKVGQTLRLTADIENRSAEKDAPSAMAMIGIPAGLSLQSWQLKELMEKEVFDFYEIKDNYLIVYYRRIKSSEKRQINLDLKAEVPGEYQAPASNSYIYYMDELKDWIPGEQVKVES